MRLSVYFKVVKSILYADEHQADLSHLAQALLSYGAYAPKSCCIMAPSDITGELISNSFSEPVLVQPSSTAVQLLGMVLPAPASLTVPEVVKTLGYEKMVRMKPTHLAMNTSLYP